MCPYERRVWAPVKLHPDCWAFSRELVQCLMYQVLSLVVLGPLKASSSTQPQGTRRAGATKQHWEQQKKKKKKPRYLEINFLSLRLINAEWAKAKNRNFPSPSCNLPPGFCETTVLSMVARCIPSPNHRRLVSSANILFFTHLDLSFLVFNFLIHFFQ